LQLTRRRKFNELSPEAQDKVRSAAQQQQPLGPHGVEQKEQPHRGGERN
nr:hypothetical protein [Acidobacteriota bacterium]